MDFLRKVSIFQNLKEDRISKMADVMDQDYYAGIAVSVQQNSIQIHLILQGAIASSEKERKETPFL